METTMTVSGILTDAQSVLTVMLPYVALGVAFIFGVYKLPGLIKKFVTKR